MRTLLSFLFGQLRLHRVGLNVHETNTRAQRSYEKSGFVREGVRRKAYWRHGDWVDGVLFGLLREELDVSESE